MSLEIIVQVIAVAGFVAAAFSKLVLSPLNDAIVELKALITDTREDLRRDEEKRQELEVHIVEVDQSVRSAHHRIDALEGRAHR